MAIKKFKKNPSKAAKAKAAKAKPAVKTARKSVERGKRAAVGPPPSPKLYKGPGDLSTRAVHQHHQ